MTYTKNTWTDRSVERPLTFTMQTNADGSTTLIPSEGTIVTPGTPITADKLNNLETQYDQAYADAYRDAKAWANGYGIGDTCVVSTDPDLNTLIKNGFYCVTGTNLKNTPLAITNWVYMIVLAYTPTYVKQILLDFNNTEKMFLRTLTNGTWGSWINFGGERGSLSNGEYLMHPDGTLICWKTISAIAGTGLQNTGIITFPMNFNGTPDVNVTHRSLAGKMANFYVYNPAINGFTLYHQGLANIDLSGTLFSYHAIGRWK